MHRFCGGDNLIISCVKFAIGNIFTDGSRKEKIILCHNAHLLPETLDADFFDVLSVDFDRALLNIIEAADQVYDGGLAGACRSYQYLNYF